MKSTSETYSLGRKNPNFFGNLCFKSRTKFVCEAFFIVDDASTNESLDAGMTPRYVDL